MEDYKEIIKQMLLRDFSVAPSGNLLQLSTAQILEMVRGVIPSKPIDEHAIFEAMREMGFQYELSFSEENFIYLWNLYKKK